MGLIYINLKGREPYGIVEPGDEYEKVRDEIIGKLKGIPDPETGGKLNIRVFKKEEKYKGKYFDAAPDILFLIEKYGQTVSIRGKGLWYAPDMTGYHIFEGLFAACGADIKRSSEKLEGLQIYDIAPTILHLLGIPIPDDTDGRVLMEIFGDRAEPAGRPLVYSPAGEAEKIRDKIKYLKKRKNL